MSDICRFDNDNDGNCPRHPNGCAAAMSDIQRFEFVDCDATGEDFTDGWGRVWIRKDRHVAAVAAAKVESYADGRVDGMRDVADLCYQRGVKAARDAVADLPNHYAMEPRHVALALAAIDASEKP